MILHTRCRKKTSFLLILVYFLTFQLFININHRPLFAADLQDTKGVFNIEWEPCSYGISSARFLAFPFDSIPNSDKNKDKNQLKIEIGSSGMSPEEYMQKQKEKEAEKRQQREEKDRNRKHPFGNGVSPNKEKENKPTQAKEDLNKEKDKEWESGFEELINQSRKKEEKKKGFWQFFKNIFKKKKKATSQYYKDKIVNKENKTDKKKKTTIVESEREEEALTEAERKALYEAYGKDEKTVMADMKQGQKEHRKLLKKEEQVQKKWANENIESTTNTSVQEDVAEEEIDLSGTSNAEIAAYRKQQRELKAQELKDKAARETLDRKQAAELAKLEREIKADAEKERQEKLLQERKEKAEQNRLKREGLLKPEEENAQPSSSTPSPSFANNKKNKVVSKKDRQKKYTYSSKESRRKAKEKDKRLSQRLEQLNREKEEKIERELAKAVEQTQKETEKEKKQLAQQELAAQKELEKEQAEEIARLKTEQEAQERQAKLEAEKKAKAEKERLAKLEAEKKAIELEKARLAQLEKAKAEKRRLAAMKQNQKEKNKLAKIEKAKQNKQNKQRLAEAKEKQRIADRNERFAQIEKNKADKAEAKRLALMKAEKDAAEKKAKALAQAEQKAIRKVEKKLQKDIERLAKIKAEKEAAERKAELKAERLAKMEAEKKAKQERDRLAKIEQEKRIQEQNERLAQQQKMKAERDLALKQEREQKEKELRAKLEADRRAKEERDRLAKIEQEKRIQEQNERLAQQQKMKAERDLALKQEREQKEKELRAKLEADRRAKEERDRLAKIEQEKKEAVYLARLAKQEKERQERLAKQEADRRERERIIQIEADKRERERQERVKKQELARLEQKNTVIKSLSKENIDKPEPIIHKKDNTGFVYEIIQPTIHKPVPKNSAIDKANSTVDYSLLHKTNLRPVITQVKNHRHQRIEGIEKYIRIVDGITYINGKKDPLNRKEFTWADLEDIARLTKAGEGNITNNSINNQQTTIAQLNLSQPAENYIQQQQDDIRIIDGKTYVNDVPNEIYGNAFQEKEIKIGDAWNNKEQSSQDNFVNKSMLKENDIKIIDGITYIDGKRDPYNRKEFNKSNIIPLREAPSKNSAYNNNPTTNKPEIIIDNKEMKRTEEQDVTYQGAIRESVFTFDVVKREKVEKPVKQPESVIGKERVQIIDGVTYINGEIDPYNRKEILRRELNDTVAAKYAEETINSLIKQVKSPVFNTEPEIQIIDGITYINGEPDPYNRKEIPMTNPYSPFPYKEGHTSSVKPDANVPKSIYHYPDPNKPSIMSGKDKIVLTNIYEEEIPCYRHYDFNWNTQSVHPYNYDLTQMPETVEFLLTHGLPGDFRMPVYGRVTSEFGPRWGRFHNGIDIDLEKGDHVYATFEGRVRFARYYGGYGNVIIIRHYNGLETTYAHLSKILVKPNDMVKPGDLIGLGGNTGRSTGSHLHFEVRYKGHPINPREMIDFTYGYLEEHTFIVDKSYFSSSNPYESAHGGPRHNHKDKIQNSGSTKYYKIRPGDSLSGIAKRFRTTVKKICSLNGISVNTTLRVGKTLRIY